MRQTTIGLLCRCSNGMSGMSGFEESHDHLADVHISPMWFAFAIFPLFLLVIRFIICAMDWDVNSATLVQIQHYFSRECSSVITGTWWTVRNQKAITMLIYWSVSVQFWLYFSLLLLLMMKQPLSMGNGENAIWFLSKLMMMCVCVFTLFTVSVQHMQVNETNHLWAKVNMNFEHLGQIYWIGHTRPTMLVNRFEISTRYDGETSSERRDDIRHFLVLCAWEWLRCFLSVVCVSSHFISSMGRFKIPSSKQFKSHTVYWRSKQRLMRHWKSINRHNTMFLPIGVQYSHKCSHNQSGWLPRHSQRPKFSFNRSRAILIWRWLPVRTVDEAKMNWISKRTTVRVSR